MRYFTGLLFLFTVLMSPAQATMPPDDTLKIIQDENIDEFTRSLDSLLQKWYVKNTLRLNNQDNDFFLASDSFTAPVFSDTIMIERLRQVNSYIDLEYNEIVQKFIDLYSVKRKRLVEIMMGLSEYYFPVFEAALDKYDVPLEIKYLPVIESALNTHAVSRAGATGLWQFMYTTGRLYDLEINSFVDERRDPYLSSQAAAEYLHDLYTIFNDWTLAIAAYNCGPGNVNKAIKRSGKTSYWEIYNYLPRETRGYVPALVAALYVMHYYKDYNITPYHIEFPLKTDTLLISQQVHFGQISAVLGISAEALRDLNPQYRKNIIPAYNDTLPLRLPSEYTLKFIELQDSIYNYADSLYSQSFYAEVPDPRNRSISRPYLSNSVKDGDHIVYKVKSGDNLGSIAERHGVTVSQLKDWNGLNSNMIRAGQKLDIYSNKGKTVLKDDKEKQETKVTEKTDDKKVNEKPQLGDFVYYTVKSGDNFWSIAKKYPGVSNTEIMEWNNITDARSLRPGQKLKIYKK